MADVEPGQMPLAASSEALAETQQREQLAAVNIYLLTVAGGMGIGYLVLAATSGSIIAPPLFIIPLYLLLWRINNLKRLAWISTTAGTLGTLSLLVGLHLVNGGGSAFVVLIPFALITFLVFYEGRGFVFASIALLLSYILIIVVEVSGIMPAPQTMTVAQLTSITPILTIASTAVSALILYFSMERHRVARKRALDQAEIVTNLNHKLLANRQLQQRISGEVTVSVQELNLAIEVQARGEEKQAEAVLAVSANAEQLAIEAKSIADRAHAVSRLVSTANDEAISSTKLINAALAAADQVYANVANVVSLTTNLSEQIKEIDKVIALLDRIAQQTHILSMNAAIEAAAVDETLAGRRFTIIAQEVQSLAAGAKASASQVTVITSQIAHSATLTTQATQEGLIETARSAALLHQATTSVRRSSEQVAESEGETRSILASTNEQQTISHEVASNLRQMSGVAQEIADGGQQLQRVSMRLNELVTRLEQG